MATGRINRKVLDHIAQINKENLHVTKARVGDQNGFVNGVVQRDCNQ